jgi:hypothetical protein
MEASIRLMGCVYPRLAQPSDELRSSFSEWSQCLNCRELWTDTCINYTDATRCQGPSSRPRVSASRKVATAILHIPPLCERRIGQSPTRPPKPATRPPRSPGVDSGGGSSADSTPPAAEGTLAAHRWGSTFMQDACCCACTESGHEKAPHQGGKPRHGIRA